MATTVTLYLIHKKLINISILKKSRQYVNSVYIFIESELTQSFLKDTLCIKLGPSHFVHQCR